MTNLEIKKQVMAGVDMDTLTKQALEQATTITGKLATDKETQNTAFHLACAVMAQYAAEFK